MDIQRQNSESVYAVLNCYNKGFQVYIMMNTLWIEFKWESTLQ